MRRVRVLGPVEAWNAAGELVDLGPARPLLAIIALADSDVSYSSVRNQLGLKDGYFRRLVGLLRSRLGDSAREQRFVVTKRSAASGSRLCLHEDVETDLRTFRRLYQDARQAEDDQEMFRLLRDALDLWTGPAAEGLPRARSSSAAVSVERGRRDAEVDLLRCALRMHDRLSDHVWRQLVPLAHAARLRHPDQVDLALLTLLCMRCAGREGHATADEVLADARAHLDAGGAARVEELYGELRRPDRGRRHIEDLIRPVAGRSPQAVDLSFHEVGLLWSALLGEHDMEGSSPIPAGWTPDLIVGINRGGCILGGMLAKRLGRKRVVPLVVLPRTGARRWEVVPPLDGLPDDPRRDDAVTSILICDEAWWSGSHMGAAFDAVRRRYELSEEEADERIKYAVFAAREGAQRPAPDVLFCGAVRENEFRFPWWDPDDTEGRHGPR